MLLQLKIVLNLHMHALGSKKQLWSEFSINYFINMLNISSFNACSYGQNVCACMCVFLVRSEGRGC